MKLIFSILISLLLVGCKSEKIPVYNSNGGSTNRTVNLLMSVDETKQRETILILNGCNGPSASHYREWANTLNVWGYNAIIVDTFSEKGYTDICNRRDGTLLNIAYSSVTDVESAGKWVQQQKWSNGKIAVIGFSIGGITSLLLSSRTSYDVDRKNIFSSIIAFYPTCVEGIENRKVNVPLQIHIGEKDEWASPRQCLKLSSSKNFKDSSFIFYENAHHGFDMKESGAVSCVWGDQCVFGHEPNANFKSRKSTKEFLESMFKE